MPVVRANGIDMFYEDSGGAGEPVVLIPGHSVDRRMWAAQWLALREAGFRVIRYDVRGHGRSSAPDTGYTWPVYAADLRALLDTLGVAAAHLVGFSMGGGVALQFALDHPARARSLALIDAAVPGFAYSAEFADTLEAPERLWLAHPLFGGLRRHPATFRVVREMVLGFPARDYLVDQPEPEGPEAIDRLGELRMPLLVLVGAEDLPDFRLAAELVAANAPHARLVVVLGAGHLLPLERPDEVNRLLLEFLGAGPKGRAGC